MAITRKIKEIFHAAKVRDMRLEYNFTKLKEGVRGKYYKAYRQGHTVKIHKADGTTTVQHFKPEKNENKVSDDKGY
jgi:hypothetical protein